MLTEHQTHAIFIFVEYKYMEGKCGTYETVGPREHLNIPPPVDARLLSPPFSCEGRQRASLGFELCRFFTF